MSKLKKRAEKLRKAERVLSEAGGFKVMNADDAPITQEEVSAVFTGYLAGIKHCLLVLTGVFDDKEPIDAAMSGLSAAIAWQVGKIVEGECKEEEDELEELDEQGIACGHIAITDPDGVRKLLQELFDEEADDGEE